MLWQPGRGGLRFGGLTGLFYSVQLTSSIARNRRDMQDTVLAALVAGAVMGTSGKLHILFPLWPQTVNILPHCLQYCSHCTTNDTRL